MSKEVSIPFDFIIPEERIMETARKMAASSNGDENTVGSSLVELTAISIHTEEGLKKAHTDYNCDMSPYFDFPYANALEAARRLKAASDREIGYVAETFIAQTQAIESSKAAWAKAVEEAQKP